MLAVLELRDFLWIFVILGLFTYAITATTLSRSIESVRLRRVEAKLDFILNHLELEYVDPASPGGLSVEVQALADDPSQKIAAVKLHRERSGLGPKEAKDAVDAYICPPRPSHPKLVHDEVHERGHRDSRDHAVQRLTRPCQEIPSGSKTGS